MFYVDPKLAKDSDQDKLRTITPTYTFYPARPPQQAATESAIVGKSDRIQNE